MKKFRIKPNRPYAYSFTVEAETEEDAIDQAIAEFHNHISWDGCDIEEETDEEDA